MFLLGLGWSIGDRGLVIFLACAVAAALAVAGLLSSTFHLGHPERAWRAFSQWRSSWLSREGVLAVATLLLFAAYGGLWLFFGNRVPVLGLAVSVLSAATVFATAMIYAQLKTVPNWNSLLTPLCYLAFALASGLALGGVFSDQNTIAGLPVPTLTVFAIALAWLLKFLWWKRADGVGFSELKSDVGTATGLGNIGDVRLFEKPHSGENYLTREMVHKIGRKHATKLRLLAIVFGSILPIILCTLALVVPAVPFLLLLAALSLMAGLFAERWLFFAEAKHAVSLYY
jgi:DMSO reductase anchor subunit